MAAAKLLRFLGFFLRLPGNNRIPLKTAVLPSEKIEHGTSLSL